MIKKKLLLIQSSPYDPQGNPIKRKKLYFVGLALPLLAALTPGDWEVEICLETIDPVPFDTDATLVAIGSMGHAIIRSRDLALAFRKRGKPVIMGGYMASLMAEEAKKYCDSVVIGDAEPVWEQVLTDAAAGTLKPFYQAPLTTSAAGTAYSTPMPRFDLIINKSIGNFLPVQAGRGCPNTCSFCSVACLYQGHYHQRPLEEVVRDIHQVRDLGFRRFLLLDDNIVASRDYLMALCQAITPLKMTWFSQCDITIGNDLVLLKALADSGCQVLSFGLESISRESLVAMEKGWAHPDEYPRLIRNIQAAGIDISTEMVLGADGDTLESIEATARVIDELGVVVPRFYILTPIPGTRFFDQMQAAGRIVEDDIHSYNGTRAVHQPRHMTPEALTEAYWKLYRQVFSFRSILRRTLLRPVIWRNLPLSLFYLVVNLTYRNQIRRGIPPNIL
ncbi:radical SAM protein [Anoxynatronum sibiricum]|uniref:Radical SAM protein n=1 Tax=Anoxynatronum sibiricum TaxID=210623 RepID=A0ABU9VTK1_9CLOT